MDLPPQLENEEAKDSLRKRLLLCVLKSPWRYGRLYTKSEWTKLIGAHDTKKVEHLVKKYGSSFKEAPKRVSSRLRAKYTKKNDKKRRCKIQRDNKSLQQVKEKILKASKSATEKQLQNEIRALKYAMANLRLTSSRLNHLEEKLIMNRFMVETPNTDEAAQEPILPIKEKSCADTQEEQSMELSNNEETDMVLTENYGRSTAIQYKMKPKVCRRLFDEDDQNGPLAVALPKYSPPVEIKSNKRKSESSEDKNAKRLRTSVIPAIASDTGCSSVDTPKLVKNVRPYNLRKYL